MNMNKVNIKAMHSLGVSTQLMLVASESTELCHATTLEEAMATLKGADECSSLESAAFFKYLRLTRTLKDTLTMLELVENDYYFTFAIKCCLDFATTPSEVRKIFSWVQHFSYDEYLCVQKMRSLKEITYDRMAGRELQGSINFSYAVALCNPGNKCTAETKKEAHLQYLKATGAIERAHAICRWTQLNTDLNDAKEMFAAITNPREGDFKSSMLILHCLNLAKTGGEVRHVFQMSNGNEHAEILAIQKLASFYPKED